MKKIIYYIIPILVLGTMLLGRLYCFSFLGNTSAFDWVFDRPISFEVIAWTCLFILPLPLIFMYFYYLFHKFKEGKKSSFIHQVFLVIAIAFFIDLLINGIICYGLFVEQGGGFAALYGFTYLFTLPVTLLVSYVTIGVLNSDIE